MSNFLDDDTLDVVDNLSEAGHLGATCHATKALVAEVRAHRSMVKRLEEWALDLEAESRLEYLDMSVRGRVAGIAAELRSRMKGA